jgi:hypothetical protein
MNIALEKGKAETGGSKLQAVEDLGTTFAATLFMDAAMNLLSEGNYWTA